MPNEDFSGRQFLGMYRGVVKDNLDPKKLGRCRICVPGVLPDEGGAWAHPIGSMGAGAHGTYNTPPKDADVAVWFEQGDPDHPYYLWGNPGTADVPPEVSDPANTVEDATKVSVIENERWRVKLDGRNGRAEAHIIDKVTNDVVEIDGVRAGIRIKATGMIQIEGQAEVSISSNGPITIGGRPVTKNGKPIN